MTCRHSDPINNPGCSSYRTPKQQLEDLEKQRQELITRFKIRKFEVKDESTPDNSNFEIMDFQEVGPYIALKVKYESCPACSYEGTKILVYLASIKQVVSWKVIDPHFTDKAPGKKHAPSPLARFPASDIGWEDALAFLKYKVSQSSEADPDVFL